MSNDSTANNSENKMIFPFSTDSIEEVKRDLEYRIDAIKINLNKLDREFLVKSAMHDGQEVSVISALSNITRNVNDYENLAMVLPTVGQYLTELDALGEKMLVLNMIEKNPNWFEAAFHATPQIPNSPAELDF